MFERILASVLSATETPEHGRQFLHYETVVPATIGQTFAFFSDASNLESLTPPWLNFTIVTNTPIVMRAGVEIDYRIRLYGLPIPWRSRIDIWEPGSRFVDRQVVGPYQWWRHEHRFEPTAGGTRVIDHVEYVPRMRWLSSRIVRRDLNRIFTYRQNTMGRLVTADEGALSPDSTRRAQPVATDRR